MPIELPNPDQYTVAPTAGFVPDRLGVRRVSIDVDRATGAYRTSLTPCPATASTWGPTDSPEVACPDLLAELMAAEVETEEEGAEKLAALQALGRIADDLVTVAKFVLWLRR